MREKYHESSNISPNEFIVVRGQRGARCSAMHLHLWQPFGGSSFAHRDRAQHGLHHPGLTVRCACYCPSRPADATWSITDALFRVLPNPAHALNFTS